MNVSNSVIPQIGVRNADQLSPNDQKKQAIAANAAKLTAIRAATQAAPSLGTTITPADPETLGLGNTPEPLTVDGLLAAWGQRDSAYDLNGDGTVGMADLVELISQLATPTDPVETPAPMDTPADPTTVAAAPSSVLDDNAPVAADAAPGMTIEGLMEAWGQRDSSYDLNGDGTVNMADLVAMLSRLAAGSTPPAEEGEGVTPPETGIAGVLSDEAPPAAPPEPMSVDGLMEAWGQKGTRYDLDGDGTVNMNDLIALLSRLDGASGPNGIGQVDPAAGIVAADPNASELANTPPPPPTEGIATPATPYTVDGLLEAWGQENSQYDLNGDGTVNMNDLLTLLARLGGPDDKAGPGRDALVSRPGLGTRSLDADPSKDRIRGLATALTNQLKKNGFEDHPPSNLHTLVSRIKLTGDEHRALMGHLQSQYPQGLGVNFRV